MIDWAFLDAAGRIPVRLGRSRDLPEGAVPLPAGLMPAGAARMMVEDGVWVERPVLPAPAVARGTEGLVLFWTGLPDLALLTLRDGETDEVLADVPPESGEIRVTLGDPGPYLVTLAAPAPWLPFEQRITA